MMDDGSEHGHVNGDLKGESSHGLGISPGSGGIV